MNLSCAIVTYNNQSIIRQTLSSIVRHINPCLQYVIYLIDNHSSDQTVDIVRQCPGNIQVISHARNDGFGAGHNLILPVLNSTYHLVINPDITLENDVIFEMISYMEANPDIGLLVPLLRFPDGRIQHLCKRNPTVIDLFLRLVLPNAFQKRQQNYTMRETNYDKPFAVESAPGCFMLFRTAIFKQLGGFDQKFFLYMEDADICRRVNAISKTVFYPYNHVIHAWQRGSHKQLKLMWINLCSAFYYFKKWGLKLY